MQNEDFPAPPREARRARFGSGPPEGWWARGAFGGAANFLVVGDDLAGRCTWRRRAAAQGTRGRRTGVPRRSAPFHNVSERGAARSGCGDLREVWAGQTPGCPALRFRRRRRLWVGGPRGSGAPAALFTPIARAHRSASESVSLGSVRFPGPPGRDSHVRPGRWSTRGAGHGPHDAGAESELSRARCTSRLGRRGRTRPAARARARAARVLRGADAAVPPGVFQKFQQETLFYARRARARRRSCTPRMSSSRAGGGSTRSSRRGSCARRGHGARDASEPGSGGASGSSTPACGTACARITSTSSTTSSRRGRGCPSRNRRNRARTGRRRSRRCNKPPTPGRGRKTESRRARGKRRERRKPLRSDARRRATRSERERGRAGGRSGEKGKGASRVCDERRETRAAFFPRGTKIT